MNSSVKKVLEDSCRTMVESTLACYSTQVANWLRDNKDVEVTAEEVCQAFDVPFKPVSTTPATPVSAAVTAAMPDYFAKNEVSSTPKKRGGRTKKTVDVNLPTCSYVMVRGKSSGKQCTGTVLGDGSVGSDKYCKNCLKKAAVKETLEGNTTKATVQPAVLPGSTVEIPETNVAKNDELQVMPIPGQDGKFREMTHGFIVEPSSDGSITALAIEDNGVTRDLSSSERKIATSMGLNLVVVEPVSVPTTLKVAAIPQLPTLQTLQVNKS